MHFINQMFYCVCLSANSAVTLFVFGCFNIRQYIPYLASKTIEEASMSTYLVAVFVPILVAGYGLRKRSLVLSGALTGIVLSQFLILANPGFLAQLLVFFATGSKATKFREERKAKLQEDYKQGGMRDWSQVLNTGGVAAFLSLVYLLLCGSKACHLSVEEDLTGTLITLAILGSLSCANGDTFSSELGSALGTSDPRLITTLKRVPRGTNGGVSVEGCLASLLGGALVGMGHYLLNLCLLPPPSMNATVPPYSLIVLGAIGGFVGSVVDSYLGAVLQYSGVNEKGQVVDTPKAFVNHISGAFFLSNTLVNLSSGIITAIFLPAVFSLYYMS